jgi:hypothetical protein
MFIGLQIDVTAASAVIFAGSITCNVSGTATITPAAKTTNTTNGNVVFTGTLSGCNGPLTQSGVTITGGTLTLKGKLTPNNCTAPPPVLKGHATYTTVGGPATGTKLTFWGVSPSTGGNVLTLSYPGSGTNSTTGSFAGTSSTLLLIADQLMPAINTACASASGLTTVDATGVNGVSMITIF